MQREQLILEHLDTCDTCSYEELAQMFDVCVMTIRRTRIGW